MEYRILGKTGMKVSRMGLGGIPIQRVTAADTKVLVHKLMEMGVNYIDTARGYSVSESYLGEALEGIRDKFVIATKSMARTKAAMAADVETSLANLRTDYIDLYQIHNPSLADLETVSGADGALAALEEARSAGKIGHIGLTAHSPDVFRKALTLPWVETIMFPYNFAENQGEEMIAACKEKNIGFICMKPLAGGALEDATLALRFVCANDNVTIAIPGMATLAEAEQNLAAVCNKAPFTEAETAEMTRVAKELGNNFCRRCNYCAPCTAGISIPFMFLMDGYWSRYDLKEWAMDRYSSQAKTASDCIGCGVCETRCPYNLPIREMLKKTAEKFGK